MPLAYVNLDLLDANIQSIAAAAQGKSIRIASKSIRCIPVLRRIMEADSIFRGVMCYTAGEAAYLLKQGFDDLLLGYPVWDDAALPFLMQSISEGRIVVFMVDCMTHVEHIERLAQSYGQKVRVCLDVDMSASYPGLHFGVMRSPLRSWAHARPVAEKIAASKWLIFDGMMGYEAQISGVGDRVPGQIFKNSLIQLLKRRSIREVAERRADAVQGISELGVNLRFVNAGGTGSIASSRSEPAVTEITAGSGFYAPALFDNYAGFRYLPAAGFAVQVVRQPKDGVVTCLGGGYTASGASGSDKLPQPHLPEGLKLLSLEGAGEVQTPLRCPKDVKLALGDPVFFRHAKAGELCERFDKLYAISGGSIVDEYVTYRGAGECFL
ncbi:amino acid deaminase/aldolase [Paenibacillus sp. GXUN7292]|uniref:amino acid deaminase/aldolase n=1 Tax=Paenibacillus sp. GXUN7292 TaxID=3422499 RepID=UPI003D7E4B33